MGLSKPVGLIVDREVIDSVSVNLVQAGTSGRTADREMFKWPSGMVLKTIDGKPGDRKHKMEAVWWGLVHSEHDRNGFILSLKAHYCTSVRHIMPKRDSCICVSDHSMCKSLFFSTINENNEVRSRSVPALILTRCNQSTWNIDQLYIYTFKKFIINSVSPAGLPTSLLPYIGNTMKYADFKYGKREHWYQTCSHTGTYISWAM